MIVACQIHLCRRRPYLMCHTKEHSRAHEHCRPASVLAGINQKLQANHDNTETINQKKPARDEEARRAYQTKLFIQKPLNKQTNRLIIKRA